MKKFNPCVLRTLIEALCQIYWYKRDLHFFIKKSICDPNVVAKLNFEDSKRNIAASLVEMLADKNDRCNEAIMHLMREVSKVNDFSHFNGLSNGGILKYRAQNAVNALRKILNDHDKIRENENANKKAKEITSQAIVKFKDIEAKLSELNSAYRELTQSEDYQKRGFSLEKIMRNLFSIYELDPKASFKIQGEQIDGAFCFEHTDYIFECKWHKAAVTAGDLDIFAAKINRKLENTLGVFLSINGFSPDGLSAHSHGKPNMLLMDGFDLAYVLENRISLKDLLRRKRQHAAQTGEIYLSVLKILNS